MRQMGQRCLACSGVMYFCVYKLQLNEPYKVRLDESARHTVDAFMQSSYAHRQLSLRLTYRVVRGEN